MSAVEVAVAFLVVVLLVGVAVPTIGHLREDARVEKVIELIGRLKVAVQRHYADTDLLAVELSDAPGSHIEDHALTTRQAYASWRGPYLDVDLAHANPFGGAVAVHDAYGECRTRPHESGFRPAGPGGRKLEGPGQLVALDRVPEEAARAVDERLDRGIAGDWRVFGRVQWTPACGGTLMVLLMDV